MARLGKNAISVYEAPEMGLLDKKSIKLDAVQVLRDVLTMSVSGNKRLPQAICTVYGLSAAAVVRLVSVPGQSWFRTWLGTLISPPTVVPELTTGGVPPAS